MSEEVALAELRAGAGSRFDPAVVTAFLQVHVERESRLHPAAGTVTGYG